MELDRAAAYFAVFYVRWLVGGQVDARLQPLAAIRAAHGNEFLRQQPSRSRARLPHRFQTVELIDAVTVQLAYAPPQALELGGCASFDHLRGEVTNCDA